MIEIYILHYDNIIMMTSARTNVNDNKNIQYYIFQVGAHARNNRKPLTLSCLNCLIKTPAKRYARIVIGLTHYRSFFYRLQLLLLFKKHAITISAFILTKMRSIKIDQLKMLMRFELIYNCSSLMTIINDEFHSDKN